MMATQWELSAAEQAEDWVDLLETVPEVGAAPEAGGEAPVMTVAILAKLAVCCQH